MRSLSDQQTAIKEPKPSVIASHVDIVYEVFGAKRGRPAASESDSEMKMVQRLMGRQRERMGHVQKIHAVKDVSFVANVGESIGIIGRNGSGKSTLLRAISGLIPPTNGSVWLSGEPSLLGVNAVLLGDLTGERNVMIGGLALGLTPREVRAKFDDIVEFSGIGDFVYMPMNAYSSGMGARLRFAISTAKTPDILMVDEALATGDAEFKVRSTERIAEIREAAGTVFLVSHSNSTVEQMCSRVLWMEKGRLIADGPAEDVINEYRKTFPPRKATGPKEPRAELDEPYEEPPPAVPAPPAPPSEPAARAQASEPAAPAQPQTRPALEPINDPTADPVVRSASGSTEQS